MKAETTGGVTVTMTYQEAKRLLEVLHHAYQMLGSDNMRTPEPTLKALHETVEAALSIAAPRSAGQTWWCPTYGNGGCRHPPGSPTAEACSTVICRGAAGSFEKR